MNLTDIFTDVAHKVLALVDLPGAGSNQHELNGVADLRSFFGINESSKGIITWHYFADEEDPLEAESNFTFYDARARSADRTGRSEWRFYYYGEFLARANVGDLLVFIRTCSGKLHGLIFEDGSAWMRAAYEFFGLSTTSTKLDALPKERLDSIRLDLLQQQILSELGIGVQIPAKPSDEELMLGSFGKVFPKTAEMSEFARSNVEVDFQKPDETLTRWLEREEQLFRALENVVIRERLAQAFLGVDDFIQYSLSVQNRRKSRMGFALQNHLAELFKLHGLRFTSQAKTEGNNKPDFIFPGQREYHDPSFDSAFLVMLGVKSTSKDRWRQVLAEADRIPDKHLCTLEAGISTRQTEEMSRQRLRLVIPTSIQATFTPTQRAVISSVNDFIEFVALKQRS